MKHRIAIGAIATVIVLAGLATAYNKVDHVRYWALDLANLGSANVGFTNRNLAKAFQFIVLELRLFILRNSYGSL